MKRSWILLAAAAALLGCGQDVAYRPTPQILPIHIKRIAIRPIINKTQQFGLEDKLALRIRDEFLRDGRYPVLPEANADGVVWVTVARYILTPVQYDASLVPTAYKLRIICDLQFVEKGTNTALWEEKNLEGILTYAASILSGGKTEEQAREVIWESLSRDIVKRVVEGFGSVTGTSGRRITTDAPSTAPNAQPNAPLAPVTNPY
ncbi:MAG: LPS assembly lipoprotein LptE [Elusimicrobiota bacterium]